MKRILALSAAVLGLTACGHSLPTGGVVIQKRYTPAHVEHLAGFFVPGICIAGKVPVCVPGYIEPAHSEYHPDDFQLELKDGNHKGWRDVTETKYNACDVNEWCETK